MKKSIAVVACLHGNEPYGIDVCKNLPASFVPFVVNRKAIEEQKRFIETDLNRCFPGKVDGNHEERLAYKLTKKLKHFDYVIDLHSTSHDCPLFGIITKPTKETFNLARFLKLQKLVIMTPQYASGKSLIDFVKCGISLEVGPHDRKENVKEALFSIHSLLNNKTSEKPLEVYEVFEIIKGPVSKVLMNNFQEIKKGEPIAVERNGSIKKAEFDFVAVLVGKKEYNDVIGLACRKMIQP